MATVELKNIEKIYTGDGKNADFRAVKGINLEIRDREFMVLVGPSGCAKSTTLRMIAGLESITSGEISIDGRVVNDVAPKDRDIAMVFQNYALYPHMNVFDNMAFGLKLKGFPRPEIEKRVNEAAEILGLTDLLKRKPKAMSGGQRQRVALGRAIVRKPKVFLFDEPLSNLDAKMRVQMRTEIAKLHAKLNATMIYVTHDQVEAMTMGDRITVMKLGEIMQVDEPLALYNKPKNKFVAGFIGSPPMNFFEGRIEATESRLNFVEADNDDPLVLPLDGKISAVAKKYVGKSICLGIRPENISDAATDDNHNKPCATARVEVSEPMGAETFLYLTTGKTPFIARVSATSNYAFGTDIKLRFNTDCVHLFDSSSECSVG